MPRLSLSLLLGLCCSVLLAAAPPARADIPDETYAALGLSRDASPKDLYEALVRRYHDPEQGHGKGAFGDLWEPTPFTRYLDPKTLYVAPDMDFEATRDECVECHTTVTPGWVHSWQRSVHGDLDEIRNLPADDSRAYKKELIDQVEANLHSMGVLPEGQALGNVSCIDCHMGVGKAEGNHKADLYMPDAANCGQCHVQQFAERESERDTLTWPQEQWPAGRPSHALSWQANVETAIWAGMAQREVADGCSLCHTMQNTCNSCHTRHEFSAAEARKPETCSTCHNGVDHNEFEAFSLSKHGVIYAAQGASWDWEKPLAAALGEGGQTGPTCQTCHMEYNGEYGHNLVRKVRWGFEPKPEIADNLGHEWFQDRKESWVQTCSNCHSPAFARSYLDMMDEGTKQGIELVKEARGVMNRLYEDKLLVGQTTNRPAPPAPDADSPGAFAGLFFSAGNFPTAIDYEFAEMWEQHIMKHFKGLAHVHPGGFTYSEGWSRLIRSLARIKDTDTQLREKAALMQRVEALEAAGGRQGWLDLDTPMKRAAAGGAGVTLAGLGLGLMLLPAFRRRRRG
ncbi:MAG: hydroxylamine reductase [Hyphomicrobiales bacterium]|nr:MAG: hydroxylamine reductase [Hyphomicrobiales bacterium]